VWDAEYESVPSEGWDHWLEYEDLLGNMFHTWHTKIHQQAWKQTAQEAA
jgi:hypothetical protein